MNDLDGVYLKPNVQVEPLVHHWYAWPMLIAPAPAAMITKNLHLRLLESFLKSPQMHVAAAKNPALRGGMFLDYSGDPAKIRQLVDQVATRRAGHLQLADSIKELDALLKSDARGESLTALYARVPTPLRGYVELVYDLANQPSARYVEKLLYASAHYDSSLQALRLALGGADTRAFVLSTPRFGEADNLLWERPFADPALDELFDMRRTPRPLGAAKELLGWSSLDAGQREVAQALFDNQRQEPCASRRHDGPGVRVRYYNHATILIESRAVTILTDPVISYDEDNGLPRFSYKDLPDVIDYVLLTHNHQDHVLFETLLQIRSRVKTLVVPRCGAGGLQDPSLKLALEATGFRNVIELDELESLPLPGGEILGLPFFGEHGDLAIRSKLGYLVRLEGYRLLALADSNNIEPQLYEHLHRMVGNVDVVFIGMECEGAPMSWLYGPLLTTPLSRKADQSRRLDGSNYERARLIVERFAPQAAYVYAMGAEPWLGFITSIHYTDTSSAIIESNRLVEYCKAQGIAAERLYGKKELYLQPGSR